MFEVTDANSPDAVYTHSVYSRCECLGKDLLRRKTRTKARVS